MFCSHNISFKVCFHSTSSQIFGLSQMTTTVFGVFLELSAFRFFCANWKLTLSNWTGKVKISSRHQGANLFHKRHQQKCWLSCKEDRSEPSGALSAHLHLIKKIKKKNQRERECTQGCCCKAGRASVPGDRWALGSILLV